MTHAEFEDAKSVWKFFYARDCFEQVENTCSFILDNNIDDQHPAYYSLMTGIYVLYAKPFSKNKVVGRVPDDIVPPEFKNLHKDILDHRDQFYAHLDAKTFEIGGHGQANQVRVRVTSKEARLFGTQFHARLPLLPELVKLCQQLQKKAEYHIDKLQKRYIKKVPEKPGEYVINVLDEKGPFLIEKPPMM